MVFYFTGTGNRLYIAKQIEEKPVSILQVIHNGKQIFSADSIGIVAPVYGHDVPPMVKSFLKNAVFHTDYFYMILTYGNRHGGAAELAKQFCDECGISVHYINVIVMVDNWLPSFDMDEQKKLDKHIEENKGAILADLAAHRNRIAEVTDADRAAHRQFLARTSRMPTDAWQHFPAGYGSLCRLRNLRKSMSISLCSDDKWKSGTYSRKLPDLSGLCPCLSA